LQSQQSANSSKAKESAPISQQTHQESTQQQAITLGTLQLQSVLADPSLPLTPSHVMQLQKTIGNQAVAQLMKSRMQQATTPVVQTKPSDFARDPVLGLAGNPGNFRSFIRAITPTTLATTWEDIQQMVRTYSERETGDLKSIEALNLKITKWITDNKAKTDDSTAKKMEAVLNLKKSLEREKLEITEMEDRGSRVEEERVFYSAPSRSIPIGSSRSIAIGSGSKRRTVEERKEKASEGNRGESRIVRGEIDSFDDPEEINYLKLLTSKKHEENTLIPGVMPTDVAPVKDQESYRIIIKGGLLYNRDGTQLIDTEGGKKRYVLKMGGALYGDQAGSENDLSDFYSGEMEESTGMGMGKAKKEFHGLAEFTGGLVSHAQITGTIVGAGDMRVNKGKISYINNQSGTFKPQYNELITILKFLVNTNVITQKELESINIEHWVSEEDPIDVDKGHLEPFSWSDLVSGISK
jgi:hypothetical protein